MQTINEGPVCKRCKRNPQDPTPSPHKAIGAFCSVCRKAWLTARLWEKLPENHPYTRARARRIMALSALAEKRLPVSLPANLDLS